MRVIPVDVYPLKKTYRSPDAAIEGAKSNPLLARARADAARLAGTTVVDANWTDTDFVIRFSNERFLHIRAFPGEARWDVSESPPSIGEKECQRVGAEPVIRRWRPGPGLGDRIKDWSALTAKRRGTEFAALYADENGGFYVYCRGQLVWCFQVVRRTDLDQPILHVTESR